MEEAGGGGRLFLPSLPSAVAAFSCASFQRLGTPGGFQAHSPTKLIASLPGHLHLTLGWIWHRIFHQSRCSFILGPWWVYHSSDDNKLTHAIKVGVLPHLQTVRPHCSVPTQNTPVCQGYLPVQAPLQDMCGTRWLFQS